MSGDNRRTIRISNEDWAEIERRAAAEGETASEYMRRRALSDERNALRAARRHLKHIEGLAGEILSRANGTIVER